ncbi:hypothetical protein SRABI26_04538 [Arthrobacter sp. Bi26]|nr:hypothetical protein SRABI26_04538 [Arthrobacter sp. Bi26]
MSSAALEPMTLVAAVGTSTGAVMGPVAASKSSMPGTAACAAEMSPLRMASAASDSLMASAGRFFGSLASMDISRARTGLGSVSGSGGGASLTWASAMAIWDSPENGRWPVRHS